MKYYLLALNTLAATIQQIMSQDSTLSKAAAVKDPLWSQSGHISVLAATDNAIASSSTQLGPASGTITFNRFIGLDSTYALIADKDNVYTLVWNNGSPNTANPPNIEIRTGLGTGSVTKVMQADNGILYITDNFAVGPPTDFITTLTALKCSKFVSLIDSVGLTSFVNGLKSVTIFAPTDGGYSAQASVIDSLSADQKRAYILHQIVPQIIYTDNIKSGNYATLLASNNITISANDQGAMFPGSGYENTYVFSQSDNFCKNGVIQRLDFWLKPAALPGPNDAVSPVNVPAGSAAYVPGSSATPGPTAAGKSNSEVEIMPAWLTTIMAALAMIA